MAGKQAIILIHGIGDQKQGATLTEFTGLFRSEASAKEGYSQATHFLGSAEGATGFSYMTEEAEIEGTPTVVAELFWSNLSPLASGYLAPFRNFVSMLAGLPGVIYATLESRQFRILPSRLCEPESRARSGRFIALAYIFPNCRLQSELCGIVSRLFSLILGFFIPLKFILWSSTRIFHWRFIPSLPVGLAVFWPSV